MIQIKSIKLYLGDKLRTMSQIITSIPRKILCSICQFDNDKDSCELGNEKCGNDMIKRLHHRKYHSDIPYNENIYILAYNEKLQKNHEKIGSYNKKNHASDPRFKFEEPSDEVLLLRAQLEAYARSK